MGGYTRHFSPGEGDQTAAWALEWAGASAPGLKTIEACKDPGRDSATRVLAEVPADVDLGAVEALLDDPRGLQKINAQDHDGSWTLNRAPVPGGVFLDLGCVKPKLPTGLRTSEVHDYESRPHGGRVWKRIVVSKASRLIYVEHGSF